MRPLPIPRNRKIELVEKIHGKEIFDPFRWLEEDSDEVQEWIKEQNKHTHSHLSGMSGKEFIRKRLNELFRLDTVGIPTPKAGRYFFQERKSDEDLSVLYVQDGLGSPPRALVNPNEPNKNKTAILHDWYPSRDGKLLAYSLSEAANDQATVYVMDVDTGKNLPDMIPAEVYPSPHTPIVWDTDMSGFWYTRRHPSAPKGEEKFHQKLYFHKLNDDYEKDEMIFGENIAKENIPYNVSISEDGRYLLIGIYLLTGNAPQTELYLYDRKNPQKKFISVIKDKEALFYGTIYQDSIYIQTNHKALLWKLMSLKIDDVEKGIEHWKTIIPEGQHKIESFYIIQNKLFVESLENVCSYLKVYNLKGEKLSEINLPTLGTIEDITGEESGSELFFEFSSFVIPSSVYRFDLKSNEYKIFKQAKSGIDFNSFAVEQVWYDSKDGTKIPMFLVYKKGLELNGNNPTLLYGYGGFNVSLTPSFSKNIILFLEHGGLYALANIRGGGEFGEEWHRAGTKERKQNVFDDFISASEWLIKKQYTNSKRLAIFGWSNGGLLTATVMTQRPELFKAVIIGAPVIDMLRYHLFFGGRHWIPDYGCAENPEDFKHLVKYCPYQNVKNGEQYPATLIIVADKDDRVHPMHAFKMAARLQEANASQNPILIRVEIKAGHGGAAAVTKVVKQYADIWSFVFWQLKIK